MDAPEEIIARHAGLLEGTRAVAPSGELLVLHHATNRQFGSFARSSDMGFHFGSAAQAAKRRSIMIQRGEAADADPWRVISCVLAVRSPVIVADDPGIWNPRWLTATFASFLDDGDRSEIRRLASALDERRPGSPVTERDEAILDQWFRTLMHALERAGHDGIVYRNVFESTGRAIEWSWVAFRDDQVVRIGQACDAETLPAGQARPGAPLPLRGARPMRHHQSYGLGRLMRDSDRKAFRKAVEEWAEAAGIEWESDYPLGYKPAFGEGRPGWDLRARLGEESGYFVVVSSEHGSVSLQPFSQGERSSELMKRFRSDASEAFFEHGTPRADGNETVTWRPAETLDAFAARLRAVAEDFSLAFPPSGPRGPRI